MPIFDSNYFMVTIRNLKLEPQRDHWCWKRKNLEFMFDRYQNSPHWCNLKEWLKKAHSGELLPKQMIPGPSFEHDCAMESGLCTVVQAFRIVDILKDLRWEKVEETLEAYVEGINASAKYENRIE